MISGTFNPFAGGELARVSPATWPQKEIFVSAQMNEEGNTAFNEAISITLEGLVDVTLLASCFNRLLDRHEALRTTFSRTGKEICLHTCSGAPVHFDYEDLRQLDSSAQVEAIAALWRTVATTPMDLENGPLFFVWVKQLTDSRAEIVIAAHHIICDGWSFGLLLKELVYLYSHNGDADGLPPAESFFAYAEQCDAEEIANSDIDYWRDKFNQAPPVLDLPLDRMRPPTRPFQASRFDFEFDPALTAQLPKAAARMKASLMNVLMAGYFTLLYRLTSSQDLVVGLAVAGQASFNKINQVGHMVQLLPIRLALNNDMSYAELVGLVKREVLDASEHPRFTFGKLMEKMVVDRSRVPLINTIFNIDQPINTLDFGKATGTVRTVPRSAENFEIFVNISQSTNRLIIETTYSTALFSEETISAWMQSFETIVANAITDPGTKISEIILTKAIPEVLQQANNTSTDLIYPDFLSAFNEQVKNNPNAEAVLCGDTKYNYQQLDQISDTVANVLLNNNIGDGDIVGICCQRSEKMVVALLALFKIGATYLPLDPDFPQDRLLYMLEDTAAAAVLEDDTAPQGVLQASMRHINIDSLLEAGTLPTTMTPPVKKANRLAYIIYTSGSTGKPKGVRVHHEALINFLISMAKMPGCTSSDRLLAITTLSFDISVLEIFLPLLCGATVIVATREQLKDGELLAELLEQCGITILQATPSTWRMLLASNWRESSLQKQHLKALCGGEPLPPDLVADLLERVAELWNMFGPTETTVWSTCKLIQNSDSVITVGKPIDNTQLYILDHNLNPLPLSTPGELFIGGQGVTQGYHNREELTAERFINHAAYGKIYRTGDLAKVLPSGELQHLGRLDDQIKLRGYRIELGEIESALMNCSGVRAAAAYLWQLSPEDVRIVACCQPTAAEGFQATSIRKQLRTSLPNYMIPQFLLQVDTIPLLPNGKVNRKGLPKPAMTESSVLSRSGLVSDQEKLIADIWTELIQQKHAIAREDTFFDIGGHSLLALDAIRKIETATGKKFKMAEIIQDSIATLAEKIAEVSPRPH